MSTFTVRLALAVAAAMGLLAIALVCPTLFLPAMGQAPPATPPATPLARPPASSPASAPATFAFKVHEVFRGGNNLSQCSLVDLDGDGRLEWIVGNQGGEIWWFEYQSADRWARHVLGAKSPTEAGGTAFDVDGDGRIDQVSGQAWYRNPGPGKKDQEFTRYPTGIPDGRTHDNVAADIDGDGKLDLVVLSDRGGLWWYKIPAEPAQPGAQPWAGTRIADGVHGAIAPHGVGDLDGDGDNDIVRTDLWLENVDGKGAKWEAHKAFDFGLPGPRFPLTTRSWVVDLDRDGDNDVVMAECDCDRGRLAWFENLGHGRSWKRHIIAETDQDLHSLQLADFDGDGDLDIFSGGCGSFSKAPTRWIIWENLDGKGGSWKEHTLLTGPRCHEAVAGDVDGDGDIDICAKPWSGGGPFLFLENLRRQPAGK